MVTQLRILVIPAGGLLILLGPQAADQETLAFEVDSKARPIDAGQAIPQPSPDQVPDAPDPPRPAERHAA
jgi:hypothetical protein